MSCLGCGAELFDPVSRLCPDCRLLQLELQCKRLDPSWDLSKEHEILEARILLGRLYGCLCCCAICKEAGQCGSESLCWANAF